MLVFEDIHWAEEPLLELIEHLATWVREAPLLLVCLARPELLDVRPGLGRWPSARDRDRARAARTEPRARSSSTRSMADGALRDDDRRQLLAKTEGNPLFLEETVRMLDEEGAGGIGADPRHAPGAHRRAHRPSRARREGAAAAGRGDRPDLLGGRAPAPLAGADSLDSQLEDCCCASSCWTSRAARSRGETAYKFKHVLIREVAYSGLSKSARAEHHARFAGWLQRAGRRGAAGDPRVPPRPGGCSARRARRRAPVELAARGSRGVDGGRAARASPARLTAPRGSSSCARSSSSRRSDAATWLPARRGRLSRPAGGVREMEEVLADAHRAQATAELEGRAL